MKGFKTAFTAFFTALSAWLGLLAVPVLILVFMNIIDYITGLIAAPFRSEKVSSYKSFRGIAKKVCQWLLVLIGVAVDWLLGYAGLKTNILVSSLVAVWLICNEIISVLENISDIGVMLPHFLLKIVKYIKGTDETQAEAVTTVTPAPAAAPADPGPADSVQGQD